MIQPADLLIYISVAVAVIFGARGGISRSTITALREQNDAFDRREKQRVKDKEREDAERAAETDRTQKALTRLGNENTTLRDLLTGRAELAEMASLLNHHDEEAAMRHAATIKVLRDIRRHMDQRAESEDG